MIRRDTHPIGGTPRWDLISQVVHARLAVRLASAWNLGAIPLPEPREAWLAAVDHHDDGWVRWEARPGIDPKSGRPRNFTEMPIAEASAIWRRSIDRCRAIDPLSGYLVSRHFTSLLERSNPRQSDLEELVTAPASAGATLSDHEFLLEQRRSQQVWLSAWQQMAPARHSSELAYAALETLQWFDELSLWFCCAHREQHWTAMAPGNRQIVWRPLSADGAKLPGDPPQTIEVDPWPFVGDFLAVEATARRVPARTYASADELARTPNEQVVLRWQLQPPGTQPE